MNLVKIYEQMFLIRAFEERLLELFSEGKLFGTTHTYIGQEATAVSVISHLTSDDVVFTNHRCHGHYLAYSNDPEGLLAEIMGKTGGICGGRGGSQHLCGKNFFSNGIQGGMVPVASGMALGQKLNDKGVVTAVCIGDGTMGEGVVYESMNMVSKWSLPLLIVLEDNCYAQSTSRDETISGSIVDRASAFGIKTYEGNTWDFAKLISDMKIAANYVRNKCKPLFFKVSTYRLSAHSKGDDDRCVSEIEKYRIKDPLSVFLNEQKDNKLIERKLAGIRERINKAVPIVGIKAYRLGKGVLSSKEIIE